MRITKIGYFSTLLLVLGCAQKAPLRGIANALSQNDKFKDSCQKEKNNLKKHEQPISGKGYGFHDVFQLDRLSKKQINLLEFKAREYYVLFDCELDLDNEIEFYKDHRQYFYGHTGDFVTSLREQKRNRVFNKISKILPKNVDAERIDFLVGVFGALGLSLDTIPYYYFSYKRTLFQDMDIYTYQHEPYLAGMSYSEGKLFFVGKKIPSEIKKAYSEEDIKYAQSNAFSYHHGVPLDLDFKESILLDFNLYQDNASQLKVMFSSYKLGAFFLDVCDINLLNSNSNCKTLMSSKDLLFVDLMNDRFFDVYSLGGNDLRGHRYFLKNFKKVEIHHAKFNIEGDVVTENVHVKSFDDYVIPVRLQYKRSFKKGDPKNYAILGNIYSGFGHPSHDFVFSRIDDLVSDNTLSVSVFARGGGEMGEKNFKDTKGEGKILTLEDYKAAITYLENEGYIRNSRTVISGTSWGGTLALMLGSYLKNSIALVFAINPVVDVLNSVKMDEYAPLWNKTDFGEINQKEIVSFWQKYQPLSIYRQYQDGYPEIHLHVGLRDKRVNPLHSIKFFEKMNFVNYKKFYMNIFGNGGHNILDEMSGFESQKYNLGMQAIILKKMGIR